MGGFATALNKTGLAQPTGYSNAVSMSQPGALDRLWNGTPAHQIGSTQNFSPMVQEQFNQYPEKFAQYDFLKSPQFQNLNNFYNQQMQPFDPMQSQQYFDQGVANPALKYYNENILPSINSQYTTGAGNYGGALSRAIAGSAENLTQGLGSLRANYLQQAQQQHSQQQQNAAANLGLLSKQPWEQFQQYMSQLTGANEGTPIVQQAQSGPLKDLFSLIANLASAYASGGGFSGLGGIPGLNASNTPSMPGMGFGAQQASNLASYGTAGGINGYSR